MLGYLVTLGGVFTLLGVTLLIFRYLDRKALVAKGKQLNAEKILEQKEKYEFDLDQLNRIRTGLFKKLSADGGSIPEIYVDRNFKHPAEEIEARDNPKKRSKYFN